MRHHPGARRRTGSVRCGAHHPAGDILAWTPAGRRVVELEGLAPVDGERGDLDRQFARCRFDLVHVGFLDLAESCRYHCLHRFAPVTRLGDDATDQAAACGRRHFLLL
jgi:hypothetical protein